MNKPLVNFKKKIWFEIKENLALCGDIGEFSNNLIHNEDIPREIYEGKPVLPDFLFEKLIQSKKLDSDLHSVIVKGLVTAGCLILGLNTLYSAMFADCYCCIKFGKIESTTTQFEQVFFSTEFIKVFKVDYTWNMKDGELKKFIMHMFNVVKDWQDIPNKHESDILKFKKTL